MADEKELSLDDGESDENGGGGGGKSKLLIIIILVLILLGGGGAAAFLLMGSSDEDGDMEEQETEEVVQQALYLRLKPSFVHNYFVDNRRFYLQAEVTLMTRDDDYLAQLEQHAPMIKNEIVNWLSVQTFEELRQPDSREALRLVLVDTLRLRLEEETGEPLMEDLLFTGFVMQ